MPSRPRSTPWSESKPRDASERSSSDSNPFNVKRALDGVEHSLLAIDDAMSQPDQWHYNDEAMHSWLPDEGLRSLYYYGTLRGFSLAVLAGLFEDPDWYDRFKQDYAESIAAPELADGFYEELAPMCKAFIEHGMTWYETDTAAWFSIRRDLDGTDLLWREAAEALLSAYGSRPTASPQGSRPRPALASQPWRPRRSRQASQP